MRTAALTLLSFVAFGYAAKAQKFSLLPQVGFENSKTKIQYNNLFFFFACRGSFFSAGWSCSLIINLNQDMDFPGCCKQSFHCSF